MKKVFFISVLALSNAFAQPFDPSGSVNMYGGLYGGMGMGGGGIGGFPGAVGGGYGAPNFVSSNGTSMPMFETTATGSSFNLIKPNASCPLLTQTVKEDQDAFLDIKNYLTNVGKRPECAQSAMGNMMMGSQTISMLESMLGNNSSTGTKCYSKNVEQISARNMAYYYAEKGIEQGYASPYSACSGAMGGVQSKDEIKKCIAEKYESLVETNEQICKEVVAPQLVQAQIDKAMVDLERLLVQSLSQTGPCAPEPKEAFKMTMNTFLKVKALSAVGPWGAVAGFGADLIGSLLDKLFPSDSQKAANLMNDILSEDNYEQNACLYFNIQQKMYCADQPLSVDLPAGSCNNVNVNQDLLKLMSTIKDVKKIVATSGTMTPANPMASPGSFGVMPATMPASSNVDLAKFESGLDDLSKFALASEADIRARVKTLPKIQQNKELVKVDKFYKLLNDYQNYDPAQDQSGEIGQGILLGLSNLVVGNDSNQKINFEELVLKTTPGLKVDSLKQKAMANAIEQALEKNSVSSGSGASPEMSRSMAKYNKYKNAMGVMAQGQFEARLNKQFKEFETQAKFVSSKEGGVIKDSVTEGMLRNLVRHCSLLQEIYDPAIEGKMPKQCEKLGCGKNNKLEWFAPSSNQLNLTKYKAQYCDKSMGFKKIEDSYVQDLTNPNGARLCGKKLEEFF